MKSVRTAAVAVILAIAALSGCETEKHAMSGARPGVKPVCRECYELAVQYQRWYPSRYYTGSRFGSTSGGEFRTVVDRVHQCPDCKSEVSFYTDNGIQKIKCATCAPEGLACDMCAPPR